MKTLDKCMDCGADISEAPRHGNRCIACYNQHRQKRYAERRVHRVYMNRNGTAVETGKTKPRIYWSNTMVADLKRRFPFESSESLSLEFGVNESSIRRKARELGIRKDPETRRQMLLVNLRQAHLVNKVRGNSGMYKKKII